MELLEELFYPVSAFDFYVHCHLFLYPKLSISMIHSDRKIYNILSENPMENLLEIRAICLSFLPEIGMNQGKNSKKIQNK